MKRTRVLIVDDERDLAEGLAALVSMRGHEVATAENGRKAVEVFRNGAFDIVFMDVRMPVMNGVDSFFEIRRLKPTVTIVMMTGFHEPTVGRATEAGALGPLQKPFKAEAMLAYIAKLQA